MANVISMAKKIAVITALVEGCSVRSTSRMTGVSKGAILRLLVSVGTACTEFHNAVVRNVHAKRVQVDEIWSFVGCKQKNVTDKKIERDGICGDVWTFTAIEAQTKLVIGWLVGQRDAGFASIFLQDVEARLANRIQLTTDGHRMYLTAVEDAFGAGIDYAMLVKIYGRDLEANTRYSPATCIGAIPQTVTGIRADRRRAGRLFEGAQLTRDVPLNWTTAQKSDPRNFSAGQVPGFNRAVKGIAKNETLEVVRIADKSVVVRNAVGEERALTGKQAKSFDVYERRSIEVATGDRLLPTANRRESGFRVTNGEIVTVAEVDRPSRICLGDGRTLPAGFRHFAHGYAVTAHRRQGKSVDAVIISGDGMRKELFYVAASRGRQSVRVITSDKESLRESVARSSMRKSASELARKAGTVFVRGACRGIKAARHLAMRLSVRETEPVPAEISYQNEPRTERHRERGIGR